MESFITNIMPVLLLFIATITGYFKLTTTRSIARLDNKKKEIELLESVANSTLPEIKVLTETLEKICVSEKINSYYNSNLNYDFCIAALNHKDTKKLIKISKAYSKNLTVKDGVIIPVNAFDKKNSIWQFGLHLFFILAFSFGLTGFFHPDLLSTSGTITLNEKILLTYIYGGFIVYLLFEYSNYYFSKKYINSLYLMDNELDRTI